MSDYCRTVLTGFVIRLSPNMPTVAMPMNLAPPPSTKSITISGNLPNPIVERGIPAEMLRELKTVLTKYYVE